MAKIVDDTATQYTAKDGLGEGDVNAIVQDSSDTIWVASHGGLAGFDGQRWRLVGEDEGLPRGPVLELWRDSQSRLWAGTTTGLYRRSAEERTFTLVESGSDGQLAEDRAGTIWVSDPLEAFRTVGRPRANRDPRLDLPRPGAAC